MKHSLIVVAAFVALLLAAGCAEETPQPRVPDESLSTEGEPTFTPAGIKAEQEAQIQMGLMIVEEAIHGYRLLNEDRRYPSSLNELVREGMMDSLPELPPGVSFTYDSEEGEVDVDRPEVEEE